MCFSFFKDGFYSLALGTSKCQAHTNYDRGIKGFTYPKKDLNFVFRDSITTIWPKIAKTRVITFPIFLLFFWSTVHFHVSDGTPPDANNWMRNHVQTKWKGVEMCAKKKSNQERQEYQHTHTNSQNASSRFIRAGRHGQGSLSQWRFSRMTQRLRQNTGSNNAAARSSSFLSGCFSCFSGSGFKEIPCHGLISTTI